MPAHRLRHTPFALILIAYLLVAGAFAIYTPDWQAPDEPAHYNYIAQLAEDRRIPVIEMGDWDQTYLDDLKAAQFDPTLLDDLRTIEYEDHQPPLYYLLAVPVYLLFDGSLTALRLYSVALGMLIVWGAYQTGLLMYPRRPWIGLGAASFVAFLPQHVHILASVNNDALGWALVAVILAATVAYAKGQPLAGRQVAPWMLGLLLGLALVTKATAYFLAGVVPLVVLLNVVAQMERINVARLARALAMVLVPALVLGGLWWLRNIAVYGFPDFLGLAAHDAVVIGQPRTADLIDQLGAGGFLREISRTTFNSFWGQFGWMALPLPGWAYTAIGGWLAMAVAGWLIAPGRATTNGDIELGQRLAWLALILTIVFAVIAYLYYNSEFQQHQGRYMFPLLVPLGVVLALGFDGWWQMLTARLAWAQTTQSAWIQALVMLAFWPLAVLDLWLLWRVIVPNL